MVGKGLPIWLETVHLVHGICLNRSTSMFRIFLDPILTLPHDVCRYYYPRLGMARDPGRFAKS